MSARRFVQVAVAPVPVDGLALIVGLTDDGRIWMMTPGSQWEALPEAPQDPEVADVAF